MKYVPPSIRETAFNCPYCGALAKQFWYSAHAAPLNKDRKPLIFYTSELDELKLDHVENADEREQHRKWAERMATGQPFFERNPKDCAIEVNNVWFSRCYNCDGISLWIYDRLVYPAKGEVPPANPDMPEDIRRDYDEASTILDLSPRGAAALIRLGIQKLCIHLGQPGKNINDDIKALVAAGLDPRVQKAMDVVRVVGNKAVHPGHIDLKDDRATAETLFKLLNLVVEKMISQPKHLDDVYESLPQSALQAIEKRDSKP